MSTDTEVDEFTEQMNAATDFLSHYGVKGMKWGTRKNGSGDVKPGKSGKVNEAPSEDSVRVGGINSRVKAQRSTKPLTNKELKDAIERMGLEQQYSKLSGGLDKTTRQKAALFIGNMVQVAAKQGGQQMLNNEFKTQFEAAANRARTKASS